MPFVMPEPKDSVPAITDGECTSLNNNTGIDPSENIDDCQAIAEQILPLIKQELDAIATGNKTIFANEDSKCKEDDPNPTLASMLSRIYRMAQAIACSICTYDPALTARLKSGRATQVLWGQGIDNLPLWVTPDATPTENSTNIATSGGVFDAIHEALLGTFHLWEGHENFTFYAENPTDLATQTGAVLDDTALVLTGADGTNQTYIYDGSDWVADDVLGVPENFATTHIAKGSWEDKEIYFFYNPETSTGTWNILDANMGQIQTMIDILSARVAQAIMSGDANQYLLTTRATLAQANAVPATAGKTTIVLITGEE